MLNELEIIAKYATEPHDAIVNIHGDSSTLLFLNYF